MINMKFYKQTFLLFFLILIIGSTVIYATDSEDNIPTNTESIVSENQVATQEPLVNTEKNIKTESKTIVLNSTNFNNYVTDKQFNENVSAGDTVDIQGKLDSANFALDISKPVNIISSTNDALLSFHTGEYNNYAESERGMLRITSEGAGTNITGIQLYNTRLSIENTRDVTINNISCIDENAAIGQNVGAVSIREGSENITITNSYFKTQHNGGHSNVVFAVAYNCLFENNTVEGYGNNIGNLLYLTTFNVNTTNIIPHNVNITIRNNIIRSYNVPKSLNICWALVLEGYGHVIDNNTINHSNIAVKSQYSEPEYGDNTELGNVIFKNNNVLGGDTSLGFNGEVNNNRFVNDFSTVVGKSKVYNNTFKNVIVSGNTTFENNTAEYVKISGNNSLINNNIITTANNNYSIDIKESCENITITNNQLASYLARGSDSINGTAIVENNTPTNLYVTINDTNYEQFLTPISSNMAYYLKDNIQDNDWICFNYSEIENGNQIILGTADMNESGTVYNLTIYNTTSDIITDLFVGGNLTILNSKLISCIYGFNSFNYNRPFDLTLINSTIGSIYQYFVQFGAFHIDENLHKDETSVILKNIDNSALGSYVDNVFYVNRSVNWIMNGINPTTGNLASTVNESSLLLVNKYTPNSETDTVANIIIDKPINMTGFNGQGLINANITFESGSEFSNISNLYINGSITANSIVNINNCTVVNGITLKKLMSNVTNCVLYNTLKITNARQCNIINNTINCTENKSITSDFGSLNIVVTNNTLISGNLYGRDSVSTPRVVWTGNYPLYPVDIQITTPDKILKDTEESITITVINNNTGTVVSKGNVEVYLDGVFQANTTLTNGVATVNVKTSNVKTMPLKIWYYSDDKYQNVSKFILVDIVKKDVNINVDSFSPKINENTTITVHLTENNTNNPINDGNIKLKFDSQIETLDIIDGIAVKTLKVEEDWILSENMTIIFDETEDYNNNTLTIPLNITLGDVVITNSKVTRDGDNVNFNLYIQNILGENIIEGTMIIKDNTGNILLEETDVTGSDLFINITPPEDDLINVEFTGWIFYESTTQQLNISIPPIETRTTIEDITGVMYTPTTLTAIVTDLNSTNMTTGSVTFTDNEGNTLAQSSVNNGIATATVTFNKEIDSTITATYNPETTEYTTSTATASLNIQKPITNIAIDEITATAEETITLTARVTDQLSNNITGGKIVFKINGKTLKDTDGKVIYTKVVDGVATTNYLIPNNLAGKNINITATYSGSSKYNKETITTTLTVQKATPTLTITPFEEPVTTGSTVTLKAKVTVSDTPITTGKIFFKINGKTLKDANGKVIYAKLDSNGEVSVDYNIGNLKVNTYTVKAVFNDPGYDKIESDTTMTVVKS